MSILTIDIGNSRIKYYQYDLAQNLIHKYITATDKMADESYFTSSLAQFNNVNYVIYSSVVPELNNLLQNAVKKQYQLNLFDIKHKFIGYGKNLTKYHSVGTDIIANTFVIGKMYDRAIIVSLGTATVISMVINGNLEGVIIAPGIYSSLNCLISNTSQLSDVKLIEQDYKLGVNTKEAISLGFYHGFYYLVTGFINDLQQEYNISNIVIGGGGLCLLQKLYQDKNYFLKEELVNLGLLEIFLAKYYEK